MRNTSYHRLLLLPELHEQLQSPFLCVQVKSDHVLSGDTGTGRGT